MTLTTVSTTVLYCEVSVFVGDIGLYLGDGAADRLEILHDGRATSRKCLVPFGGDIFRGSLCQMRGQKWLRGWTKFGLSDTD